MTEAELQAAVTGLCDDKGLWWFHAHDNPRNSSGFVDLVIVGSSALFVELKSADGRRSMPQIRWAGRITKAGLQYRLWRPGDWDTGIIAEELEGIR